MEVVVAVFEVFRDYAGRYRWRLRSGDGRISADSGDSHQSPEEARAAAARAKVEALRARVRPLPEGRDVR